MSKIYIHYVDKTLVLDSGENLVYPLLGSLLKWDELRVAMSLSLTQSTVDDNAGFSTNESLPIVGGTPILNRVAIGLKNRGTELPGEAGCSFAGFSNATDTDGSSLGYYDSTIMLSTRRAFGFNVNLSWTGQNHVISGSVATLPLSTPFNASGTTQVLPVGQPINYGGNVVYLNSPVSNGQTSIEVTAPSPVTITISQLNGSTESTTMVRPNLSLGCSINSTYQYSQTSSASQTVNFPASFVMQGSTNYSSVMMMSFKTTNRGTSSQTMQVGCTVVPNIGDTSANNLEAMLSTYVPAYESSVFGFNTIMPSTFFVRWPFSSTRLRMHSLVIKKF